jgi:hypothetical protein
MSTGEPLATPALRGAGELALEGHKVKNHHEFAAAWNAMTTPQREAAFQHIQQSVDDALRCVLEDHNSLVQRVEELSQQLAQAREGRDRKTLDGEN